MSKAINHIRFIFNFIINVIRYLLPVGSSTNYFNIIISMCKIKMLKGYLSLLLEIKLNILDIFEPIYLVKH